tara:strand:+ start:765 stop:1523 length:759 start_codon:yes stop_codon:yes gene_type:complete
MINNKMINNDLFLNNKIECPSKPWSIDEFKTQINNLQYRYHIYHPLDIYIMDGKSNKELFQSWVANRYYYQCTIPKKDSAILSKCDSIEIRREWAKNINDADKVNGGIEQWLNMGIALGLTKEEMNDFRHVLPGVKFACDKYLSFVKETELKYAIASCLTVTFATEIHEARLNNWPKHYDFLTDDVFKYFKNRPHYAKIEKQFATNYILNNIKIPEEQCKVIEIIKMKQDILWCILDSIYVYHFTNLYNPLK